MPFSEAENIVIFLLHYFRKGREVASHKETPVFVLKICFTPQIILDEMGNLGQRDTGNLLGETLEASEVLQQGTKCGEKEKKDLLQNPMYILPLPVFK
jgi:hypothetical protein